jgi:hypothetical protein
LGLSPKVGLRFGAFYLIRPQAEPDRLDIFGKALQARKSSPSDPRAQILRDSSPIFKFKSASPEAKN